MKETRTEDKRRNKGLGPQYTYQGIIKDKRIREKRFLKKWNGTVEESRTERMKV